MKKACSFCGRTEKEVKLLITGISGYICENCTEQAYRILQEHDFLAPNGKKKGNALKVPKPQEIKKYLDEYVIGQDEAK